MSRRIQSGNDYTCLCLKGSLCVNGLAISPTLDLMKLKSRSLSNVMEALSEVIPTTCTFCDFQPCGCKCSISISVPGLIHNTHPSVLKALTNGKKVSRTRVYPFKKVEWGVGTLWNGSSTTRHEPISVHFHSPDLRGRGRCQDQETTSFTILSKEKSTIVSLVLNHWICTSCTVPSHRPPTSRVKGTALRLP